MAIYDKPHSTAGAVMIDAKPLPEDFVLQEVLAVTADSFDDFALEWGRFASDWDETSRELPDVSMRDRAMLNLSVLQMLARHYIAFSEHDEASMIAAWRIDPAPTDAEAAWTLWEHRVNEALRAFPMHVRLKAPRGEYLTEIQRRTTFEVAVLQLAQTATEGRVVRRCANELCPNGGRFTRQRSGRRQYDGTGHAAGIRYCSPSCARAQSERERRRRRRAEKGDAHGQHPEA